MRILVTILLICWLSTSVDAAILVMSPSGAYTSKATLAEAATAADASGRTVIVTSALSAIQSNISSATVHGWPSDRALKVEKGGSIGNTTKFSIGGPFSAGLHRVFAGTGSVFFGPGSLTEVYSEWWGCIPDEVTACSSSIQKALDSIGVFKARVVLGAGKYKIDSTVNYTSTQEISGNGDSTILNVANGVTAFKAVSAGVQNTYFEGLYFIGGDRTATGIDVSDTFLTSIKNCRFEKMANGVYSRDQISTSASQHNKRTRIDNAYFYDNLYGVYFGSKLGTYSGYSHGDLTITNSQGELNGTTLWLESMDGLIMAGNTFFPALNRHLYIKSGNFINIGLSQFFETDTAQALYFEDLGALEMDGVTAARSGKTNAASAVYMKNVENFTISSLFIESPSAHGLDIDTCSIGTIQATILQPNSASFLTSNPANTYSAIAMTNSSSIDVSFTATTDRAKYGISTDATNTSHDISITGQTVGFVTADVNIPGTNILAHVNGYNYGGRQIQFSNNSATPNVNGTTGTVVFTNTATTTVTELLNPVDGGVYTIYLKDNYTTIDGGKWVLKAGAITGYNSRAVFVYNSNFGTGTFLQI